MLQNKLVYITILLIIWIFSYLLYNQSKHNNKFDNIVMVLYRQCARWAVAAEQDDNSVISVLHANYAAGYLWAIKDITHTSDFKRITGQDFLEFEKKIVSIQDKCTKNLASSCKTVIPTSDKDLLDAIYGKL